MFYAALVLALTLAAVAGILFYYAMFLDARSRQQGRRIAELERANASLREELRHAKVRAARPEPEGAGEVWPEVLDEREDFSRN